VGATVYLVAVLGEPSMKISITGDLGSGKTTVAKLICEKLGIAYFSTGAIQRELASKLGVDTLSLNKITENDRKIDDMVDSALSQLNNTENPVVIDARMGWFFIPSSFKVYLHVDINIAAERVAKDMGRTSEKYNDISAAKKELLARKMSENKRFITLYNADCSLLDNYDLVIDSSSSTPAEIAELIISRYNNWEKDRLENLNTSETD
jgi:cytidylate kinase